MEDITEKIDSEIQGIAIDAPLIINNQSGQRQCERELSQAYGKYWASCHASNLKLYPDPLSVKLSEHLQKKGFRHIGHPDKEKFQIEVYPHPAIIEIFGLKKRLLYKKGQVAVRRQGQITLSEYIISLKGSKVLKLSVKDNVIQHQLNTDYILSLKGQSLKMNEDALDSIICLYTCALYVKDESRRENTFGTDDNGYIYVPRIGKN